MSELKENKKLYNLKRAFSKCFCDQSGGFTKEGEQVIAFLRDICGAKGELGKNGSPYLYDQLGRFDACAVAFLQGKRCVFDQIVKHLALDERQLLNLIAVGETEESNFVDNINI
jgi:hypothetical protein